MLGNKYLNKKYEMKSLQNDWLIQRKQANSYQNYLLLS